MTRTLLVIAAGAILGLLTHIITLLTIPYIATTDAFSRITTVAAQSGFTEISEEDGLTFLDPTFVHAACAYDLRQGAIRVRVPELPSYFSVSFHDRLARAFFVINDKAAHGGAVEAVLHSAGTEPFGSGAPGVARVSTDDMFGFVIVHAAVPNPTERKRVLAHIRAADCGPVRTTTVPDDETDDE